MVYCGTMSGILSYVSFRATRIRLSSTTTLLLLVVTKPPNNEQDFRWVVIPPFEHHGWQVKAVYLGNPMRHDEKYLLINQGFAGKQRLMPFFNRSNTPDLILAIQSAGVSRGRNSFRKDKSGEKLAESEENLLEHRTDDSDAFDTLYIGCEKFPVHDIVNVPVSGVM